MATTFITFHKKSGELVSIYRNGGWSVEAITNLVKKAGGVGTVKFSKQELWKSREWVNKTGGKIYLPVRLSELRAIAEKSAQALGITTAEFLAYRRKNKANR